jgi:hypothetical protein
MENIDITLDEIEVQNVDSVLTGPPGPAGFSPIATVSKTGNVTTITITDEDGTTTAQVTDGTNGSNGQNNTLTIGTVSTGVTPSATITGDSPNQVLNLVLPKGDAGSAGVDGTTPTITIGSVTTVAPSSPATVTNGGTDTNVILNFEIPQGVQGDTTGCLSVPTVVTELPSTGVPGVFYFVPKTYTSTTVTGDSVSLSITENSGRFSDLQILGNIEQSTPPDDPVALTGTITVTVGSDDYEISLGSEYLAKVTTHQDRIYYDDEKWYIEHKIGYIASYAGETITTDYVSTSGSLTTGDEVYYVLDGTQTNEIEDANLLGQLNALFTQTLAQGTVAVITSANVTCDLSLSYYSFDINNQYDKYVYLIESSNYERI